LVASSASESSQRFYYQEGVLVPWLEVPLLEVKEILRSAEDSALARRAGAPQTAIEERMRHYRKVVKSLREFVIASGGCGRG
jgi:hypothetical protein